ncbi:MAG: hypothetical protein JO260_08250 [Acidobacteria bacterium]|nr:hypothetical protein [Acidobacteriota bacterium]
MKNRDSSPALRARKKVTVDSGNSKGSQRLKKEGVIEELAEGITESNELGARGG